MKTSFFSRRSFLIVMVTIFMMPFLLRGTRLALSTNRNDVKDWLPSHFQETKDHQWFKGHFPHEQFALVSWEGCTLGDPKLEMFARKLETQPEADKKAGKPWYFKSVLTGSRLVEQLQTYHPDLSRRDVLRRLEGSLIGKPGPHDDLEDDESYKTCLVVTLSEAAKGKNLRASLAQIRQIAVDDCAIAEKDLHMGGPPVDNVAIDIEGERTLFRLAGLSAVVGLVISWFCFRSLRLTFLVFFIALLAAGLGLASVYWTGLIAHLIGQYRIAATYGTCDAILLSMPSLVYVLAISGAVHIVNYYHDAVREHGLDRAPERALAHGMIPCALAALTTALGLGSLLASQLIPISKFGIYSAWGVLGTLLLLFLFLPACLHYFPSREHLPGGAKNRPETVKKATIADFWNMVGRFVIKHNIAVGTSCLALMLFVAIGLTWQKPSVKLMKLFDPDARILHDYAWLEEHLGPLVPMEVIIRVDNSKCRLNMVQRMRMARDVEHAVEGQLDDVGGALSAATFAPLIGNTASTAKFRFNYDVRDSVISKYLNEHRSSFREYLTVDGDATLDELGIPGKLANRLRARQIDSLAAIRQHPDLALIKGIDLASAVEIDEKIREWESTHGTELWRVSARVWALTDLDYSVFVHTIKEKVEKVLDDDYRKLSEKDLADGVEPIEGIDVVYTGLLPLVYKAQHELLEGLNESLMWAFGLIALVMILVLRSPTAGLMSMVPNLFPVVIIFGAMGWLGIVVDVGTMMTASVALGVAVDDTIHFLTWFRRGLDKGHDRKGAVMLAYERCGTAMTQTTLIGGLGLSVFAFSTFTPTQRFGVLMLLLLVAALIGDLIFLPAVLSSPIGRFFDTRARRKRLADRLSKKGPRKAARHEEVIPMPTAHSPHGKSVPHSSRVS